MLNYFTVATLKQLREQVDAQKIIDFSKDINFLTTFMVCFLFPFLSKIDSELLPIFITKHNVCYYNFVLAL